jgi:flagellar hook-basal body complex protein FliE
MSELIIGQLNPNMQLPELRKMPGVSGGKDTANFGDMLKDAISTVNDMQKQSDQEIQKLMAGETQDLHSTLIAVQKADLTFQTMMQVRNKILQAYQEIMRMQV